MATTVTTSELIAMSDSPRMIHPVAAVVSSRPRRISPEAGRALEMLGHAIEYLADEFAHEYQITQVPIAAGTHPQLKAIELLMARNREVYFSCPELPTLGEWMKSLLQVLRA